MRVPGTGGRGVGAPVTMQRVVNYGECCAAAGRNVCRLSLPFNLLFFSPPPILPSLLTPDLETELPPVFPQAAEIGLNGDTPVHKSDKRRGSSPPRRREIVD